MLGAVGACQEVGCVGVVAFAEADGAVSSAPGAPFWVVRGGETVLDEVEDGGCVAW